MQPIEFISPFFYGTVWYFFILAITWMTMLYYIGSDRQKVLMSEDSPSQGLAVVFIFVAAFYWGSRPVSYLFGDMRLYEMHFNQMGSYGYVMPDFKTEWLWHDFTRFCWGIGLNSTEYFFAVDLVYYGGMLVCCLLLMRKNLWLAVLFFVTSFQTVSYGNNGIRNGFACSVELVALALAYKPGIKRYIGLFFMYLAMGIHRSTIIPTAAALMTLYLVKDTKNALRFWVVSIFLSLTVGPFVSELFMALGFDDRMTNYYQGQYNAGYEDAFSHTGFRWDFLLYSAFGPLMIWYVTRKRHFNDIAYTMFANAYLIGNAFWIIIIRASFSNRFAYLSWFLYPVIIAYPILRMNLWKDQDRKTAIILFLYSGFLFFMYFVYYYGRAGLGFESFDKYWWIENS